jgi:cysteine-rich repeat protein
MTRRPCLMAWLVAASVSSGCVDTGDVEAVCGDGQREGALEECDDGNLQAGDGCTSTCTLEPYCGDTVQDADEECDDGNNAGGDGCSAGCLIEPFCGDGARDPGEDCDDGAHVPSDGCSAECKTELRHATTANWSFRNVGSTTSLSCPTGFPMMQVHSQALSDTDAPLGAEIVDMFSCSAMTGTIMPVFEGRYRTFLAVTNATGTQTYATTASRIVDLRATDMDYTAAIFNDGGYFKLAWNLVGAMTNTTLSCQSALSSGVSVLSTDVASPTTFIDEVFACTEGEGLTGVLPEGTYTVSISAIDVDEAAVGTAPALTNKVIQGPNRITDLGMVTIPIDGL